MSFIKGFVFWVLVIVFCLGSFIGFQAGSYLSFSALNDDFNISKEVKFSYRHNIFYKLNKWADKDSFNDVKYLEK